LGFGKLGFEIFLMLLAIDVGNTNITLGIYDGEALGPRWRLATVHERMADEYGLQLIGLALVLIFPDIVFSLIRLFRG